MQQYAVINWYVFVIYFITYAKFIFKIETLIKNRRVTNIFEELDEKRFSPKRKEN